MTKNINIREMKQNIANLQVHGDKKQHGTIKNSTVVGRYRH